MQLSANYGISIRKTEDKRNDSKRIISYVGRIKHSKGKQRRKKKNRPEKGKETPENQTFLWKSAP
jgi:hypothetical protein